MREHAEDRRVGNLFPLILIALCGGVAVAVQAHFMGVIDSRMGTLESVFITYGSGGLLIGLLMAAQRGGQLGAWRTLPLYTLSAGLLGLVIVACLSYSTPRLGLVATLTVVVAAQMVAGALLHHYGWLGAEIRPLDLTRVAGIVSLLLGVWLLTRA